MDTILEDLLTLQHENEMYIEQMKFALVAESYIYLRETGTELVLEADSIKEKISKFIKTLKEKVHNFVSKIKEFIANRRKAMTKRIAAKKNKGETVTLKGFNPAKIKYSTVEENIKSSVDELLDAANKLYDNVQGNLKGAMNEFDAACEQNIQKFDSYKLSLGVEAPHKYEVKDAIDFFEKYNEGMGPYLQKFEKDMNDICNKIDRNFSGIQNIGNAIVWSMKSSRILDLCSRWTGLATSIYRLSERIILA